MAEVSYPYDSSGNAPSNLIRDEPQVLTRMNADPFRYFIPDFAPFYETNFSLRGTDTLGNSVTLRKYVDYNFATKYIGATRANGLAVWGSVYIIRKDLQGTVYVTYQCLGGQYSANRNYVVEAIAANNYNPRRCAWDQLTNVPEKFPPSGHSQDIDTFTGFRDLIDAVDRLVVKVGTANPLQNAFYQHVLDVNDPHRTMVLVKKYLDDNGYGNPPIPPEPDAPVTSPVTPFGFIQSNVPTVNEQFGDVQAIDDTGNWMAVAPAAKGWVDIYRRNGSTMVFAQRITRTTTGVSGTVDYGARIAFSSTDNTTQSFDRIVLAISWPSANMTSSGVDLSGASYAGGRTNGGIVQIYRLNNALVANNTWTYRGNLVHTAATTDNAKFGTGLEFIRTPEGQDILFVGTAATNKVFMYKIKHYVSTVSMDLVRSEVTVPALQFPADAGLGYSIQGSYDGKIVAIGAPGPTETSPGAIGLFNSEGLFLAKLERPNTKQLGKNIAIDTKGTLVVSTDPTTNTLFSFRKVGAEWFSQAPKQGVFTGNFATLSTNVANFGKSITRITEDGTLIVGGEVLFKTTVSRGGAWSLKLKKSDDTWQMQYSLEPERLPFVISGTNNAAAGQSTVSLDGGTPTALAVGSYSLTIPVTVKNANFKIIGGRGSQAYRQPTPATRGSWSTVYGTVSGSQYGKSFSASWSVIGGDVDIPTCRPFPTSNSQGAPSGWASNFFQVFPSGSGSYGGTGTVRAEASWKNVSDPGAPVGTVVQFNQTTNHSWSYTPGTPASPGYYYDVRGPSSVLKTYEVTFTANGGMGNVVGETVEGELDLLQNGYYGNFVSTSKNSLMVAVSAYKYSRNGSNYGGVYLYSRTQEEPVTP